MSQGFGGGTNSSSDHQSFGAHVAQQSRRDKLRHQFFSDISFQNSNPNPNHEFLYNCTNMFMNSSGILDLAHDASSSSFINPSSAGDNWINSASAHPLLQSHAYHLESQHLSSSSPYENTLQAMINASSSSTSLGFEGRLIDHNHEKVACGETQGLALSLASNPCINTAGFNSCSNVPPKISVDPRRSVGPLGPFTGYATILRSSEFLKPAQQLLDEFCSTVMGSNGSARIGNSVGVSRLPTLFHSRSEGDGSGENCSVDQLPEIQQKKVKLLYMQEEVCRRYNQYRQQMKMVVSSFESVAGLSAATPYTSLALEEISKQFKCIKQAISNQLCHVSRVLGEDFMSSPSSSSRGETSKTPWLKHLDRGLRKQNASDNTSVGFLDNNQPVWRPQRGLPERAVSVLRAWLFEHFLHPYPTDTDKHMLATQTGLTRNQVSNWFINARVRLWKPMIEEIHMLESKGVSEMDHNSSNKNDGKLIIDDQGSEAIQSNKMPLDCSSSMGLLISDQGTEAIQSNKMPLDCSSSMDHLVANLDSNSITIEQWKPEKRTRVGEIDGSLFSFGYAGGLDIGGLGAVSLTLGLRQNEDPQQRHFGSQVLHDFVG